MSTDTPDGFYLDVQAKGSAFRLRIDRELVEDELGQARVDRAAFEDWAALNMIRITNAALAKCLVRSAEFTGDNPIICLGRREL